MRKHEADSPGGKPAVSGRNEQDIAEPACCNGGNEHAVPFFGGKKIIEQKKKQNEALGCGAQLFVAHKACRKVNGADRRKEQKKKRFHIYQSQFFVFSKLKQLLIQFDVFVRASAPAEVAFHCTLNKLIPMRLVIVSLKSSAYRAEHIVRIVGFEGEAVALSVAAVGNGVAQAACFADNGKRSVAQRNHLRKTARLAL